MPKKPHSYLRPTTVDEALAALALHDYLPLAGGAHMLATETGLDAAAVVDLQDLGLDGIEFDPASGDLRVGAMTRLVDLETTLQDGRLPGDFPRTLREAVHRAGPNTYRNAATLGGVVASRLPDSELLAALLVANARLTMRLPQSETVGITAYVEANSRPQGLITAVTITLQPGKSAAARVARTPADYPIVSVTGWLPQGGAARLAATGIAARPLRLTAVEAACQDGLNEASLGSASAAAAAATTHPGDFRGDAAYRAEMAVVLARRVLQELIA